MNGIFSINGFHIALHHVRNVYPVEVGQVGYEWGFKFTDGFFESFTYSTRKAAVKERDLFLQAWRAYWASQ